MRVILCSSYYDPQLRLLSATSVNAPGGDTATATDDMRENIADRPAGCCRCQCDDYQNGKRVATILSRILLSAIATDASSL
jgi:hypothetical protein